MFRLCPIALVACGGSAPPAPRPAPGDPVGSHRALVDAQVRPLLEAELVSGIVVGIYEAGKQEIYGFGVGPGGKAPDGNTLFELGAVTKTYTALMLADSVQRREVDLDGPVAELLPPGVTAPTKDKVSITLRELAVHSAGLPAQPPSLGNGPDPYGRYGESELYQDLVRTQLEARPGERIFYSDYGYGLLGHVLGRKIGGGYAAALTHRVLGPLRLADTFLRVPPAAAARRAPGTNEDLATVPPWTFDAMAGTGALVSTVRDQLAFVAAEIDATLGSHGVLRNAMRLTQEPQLEARGENEGLGWQIDTAGRYWHSGATGGFHSFIGFDPKAQRGLVVLASTNTGVVDQLAGRLYHLLSGETVKPLVFPDAKELATYVGSYDFGGTKLQITQHGKRLYIEGPGEPKFRMVPISEHELWIERLKAVVTFEREGDRVKRAIFIVGEKQLSAPRL